MNSNRRKIPVVRVGMTGAETFENTILIKETIFKLKKTFGEFLEIISRGSQNGADKHIRKFSLEFGCRYVEFNPAHTVHTLYSKMHESYYMKDYSPRNFFVRDSSMAKYIDYLIIFDDEKDKNLDNLKKTTEKQNKKIIVLRHE